MYTAMRRTLVQSALLVGLVGWLLVACTQFISTYSSNEDGVALLYLVGFPLLASAGCAAVWWLCARQGVVLSAQQRLRSMLVAPVVYVLAERGTVYGLFARQHLDLSTAAWIAVPATCWLLAVLAGCGAALIGRRQTR